MKWKLALVVVFAAPAAYAEPWLCTNEYGNREFSYDPASAGMKNCVHHPIPSGNVFRSRPRDDASADFPRVDARTQKQRDAARRAILERELAEEKKALAVAMKQLAEQKVLHGKAGKAARVEEALKLYQDRVRVHLTNISNLEKELGREG
jgi:hypothetical protein